MRLVDLFEAPIADFSFHGDANNRGSLRMDDVSSANNPKWKIKVEKAFKSVHEDINLVLINKEKVIITNINGVSELSPHAKNLADWSGTYKPSDFERTFKFLPKEYNSRINIILLSNEGDQRIPLTGWMVAHRFMHALANNLTSYPRMDNSSSYKFGRYFEIISNTLRNIDDYQYTRYRRHIALDDELSSPPSLLISPKERFKAIGTFASARFEKIERPGEFIIELATQYFLKGNFDFNLAAFLLPEDMEQTIIKDLTIAKQHLEDAITASIGKLIVF